MKIVQMGPLSTFKRRATHLALGLGLAATLAFGAVMPASADEVTGSAAITGPTSAVITAVQAPVLSGTLDGTDQDINDPFNISVNDSRGTGAGWSIAMKADQFTHGGDTSKKLALDAASIDGYTVACAVDETCTEAANNAAEVVLTSVDKPVVSAALGTGLGSMTVTPTLKVAVPANTYAGTYTSKITLTFAQVP